MSTVPHQAASSADEPLANLLFDYPGADVILRSQDSYHFRVPKIYIINGSPVLGELIRRALNPPRVAVEASLPVVQLPEIGEIIHCLLTFVFPVTPLVPSAPEEVMKLLSVAQKYQMETALTYIRIIARQNSPPTGLNPALRIYSLAQEYGLRPEALQAARDILKHSMTIEDFDDRLDIMPGPYLYELWKYHERVRAILASDLSEFRASGARGTVTGLRCTLSSSQIPTWLDRYVESLGISPSLFNSVELNIVMARHIKHSAKVPNCECASIPAKTILDFWEALSSVVHGSFESAESALSLVRDLEDLQARINPATSPLEPFELPDANIIIRSSDLVNFRVHKSVLALVSPFFKDLLSLPQPSDGESVDGLSVVQLSEDSELLNSLVSILYPVRTVMPNSYEKVLYLLAACQKYEMSSVQSSIRAEVKRGEFPSPEGAEAFPAYAIASAKDLIPEMESAARLTLNCPMTFEILGEGLRLFEGWALRDLVKFRKRCEDNLVSCLDSFLEVQPPGPSSIWLGCPEVSTVYKEDEYGRYRDMPQVALPNWLNQLLSLHQNNLTLQKFAYPLHIHSGIYGEYFTALKVHKNCNFCSRVHIMNGLTFSTELENQLAQACNKVRGDRGSNSC